VILNLAKKKKEQNEGRHVSGYQVHWYNFMEDKRRKRVKLNYLESPATVVYRSGRLDTPKTIS
jgi:hypothetical protein